jgi:hypothetical protein
MNLILSFMHVRKPAHVTGPFQAVRLDASTVRNAANDEVLAVHREHQWEVEGVRYHRVDSSARVRIHFERSSREPAAASRRFGPFDRFSAVDGIAYADDRVFAALDASARDWFCYEDGRRWHFMVVTDAAAGSAAKALALLAALAPLLHGLLGVVTPRRRASRSPRPRRRGRGAAGRDRPAWSGAGRIPRTASAAGHPAARSP